MKKFLIIFLVGGAIASVGCSDKNSRGRNYMPDMGESRAYETYAERDTAVFSTHTTANGEKIFYNNMPVNGTIARGHDMPFSLAKDKANDSTNYVASKAIVNPLPALNKEEMVEAERQYLIHCGICHGAKLDGNGPLYNDGNGKYSAAPKNLMTLAMPDGQMFYSITYGKNAMGSYASQLTPKQRWAIIHYIKAKQKGDAPKAAAKDSTAVATK